MKKSFAFCLVSLALSGTSLADESEAARNARFAALLKTGDALVRKDFQGPFANYWHDSIDAARTNYEAALKADYTVPQKIEILARLANCRLEATRDVEGAMKDLDAAIELAAGDARLEEMARANRAKLASQLDGSAFAPKAAAPGSWNPVLEKLAELFREGGLAKVEAELPKFVGEAQSAADADVALEKKPRYYWDVWSHCTGWARERERAGLLQQKGARAFLVAFMEAAPDGQKVAAPDLFAFSRGDPQLAERHAGYARQVLDLAAEPKARIRPELVAEAKRVLALQAAKGDAEALIGVCASTNKVEFAENLAKTARQLLKSGDEATARRLWEKRETLVPVREQPVLDVPYWADAPHDARGIVESEFYRKSPKGLLNRKYGDNLKFLIETDSAITGREMTTDGGEKFRPTELFAFWDAQGVKILLRTFSDDMKAVREGFAGLPGYETYLATGVEDPYHCIMVGAGEADRPEDHFVTQYDNVTGYRQLRAAEGTFGCQSLYLDDGGAVLLSVPWTAVFTATPWKRPDWYFEPIQWAHGGMSWGGSKSVHHRSSFGRLHFTGITPESAAAVKRTLLPIALKTLDEACSARFGGSAELWSDPVLGDQAFYAAEVRPLVARLRTALKTVGRDMTDEAADRAWDEAGEDAMNIDYLVSLRRTRWLGRKRLGVER